MSVFDSRSDRLEARGSRSGPGRIGSPGSAGATPNISSASSGTPNATDATITWTTDKGSDTQVFWGLTTAYAGATSPIINPAVVTAHSQIITGLVTSTTYHYKVRSRVPGGGWSESADGTFVTA